MPRPKPAEPAAELSRRARLALEELQASTAATTPATSTAKRPGTGRTVRRLVRVLVPLATAGVLVLTGPQLVTSTRSLGHDVWDQLNGGTASSACAPGGRPAAQVEGAPDRCEAPGAGPQEGSGPCEGPDPGARGQPDLLIGRRGHPGSVSSMAAWVDRVDAFQQRHPVVGFPLAVVYKFFDDQGNYLAAIVTYYAFIAIFPLLLIASSVLGLLLKGDAELRQAVLTSALSQFPIVGTQIGAPQGLQGSVSAVVIGSLAALYGVLGLGQAAQNAVNTAWSIPRNSRLNPVVSRVRSFILMVLAGVTVLLVAMLSSASSHLSVFGADAGTELNGCCSASSRWPSTRW